MKGAFGSRLEWLEPACARSLAHAPTHYLPPFLPQLPPSFAFALANRILLLQGTVGWMRVEAVLRCSGQAQGRERQGQGGSGEERSGLVLRLRLHVGGEGGEGGLREARRIVQR